MARPDNIKAIIIDDERKSRNALQSLLKRHCPGVEVVGEADGVSSAKEEIGKNAPDVLFLDIQMPDGSGFRLLEELGEFSFDVIFTTAYDQYAIKAIKYSALDYLLKPIVPEELMLAVNRLKDKKTDLLKGPNIKALLDNLRHTSTEPRKIILSTADKIHLVDVDDIIRCESDNYYTKFYFKDGKTLLISKTLKEHEELLRPHNFIRPHKSHLVNLKYVTSFYKHDGGYIMMTDSSMVPVSRRKREKIVDILNNM